MSRPYVSPFRVAVLSFAVLACAHLSQFDRDFESGLWQQAAVDFQTDSSLLNNEAALYRAGMLYGSPDRPTYDPQLGRAVLARFVARFPESKNRADAASRMALLDTVLNARAAMTALQVRLDSLTADLQRLHVQADSAAGLRLDVARLEQDVKDRESQIKAIRTELEALKAIDLKRKPPL